MTYVLGLDCKTYRNSGTYESPSWVEIDNIRDLTCNLTKTRADVTTRGQRWRALVGALKEATFSWSMVHDTEDENFAAVQDGFFNDTQIEFLFLDGDVVTSGSEGIRATCEVFNFSRGEPLEQAVTEDVEVAPAYSSHPPEYYEVP